MSRLPPIDEELITKTSTITMFKGNGALELGSFWRDLEASKYNDAEEEKFLEEAGNFLEKKYHSIIKLKSKNNIGRVVAE